MRRPFRFWLGGMGVGLSLAGQAAAEDVQQAVGRARICAPQIQKVPESPFVCPPFVIPPEPEKKKEPGKENEPPMPPEQAPEPAPSDVASGRAGLGSEVALFGDAFGSSVPVLIPRSILVMGSNGNQLVTVQRSLLIRDAQNPALPANLTAVPPNMLTIPSLTVLGQQLGAQVFLTANSLSNLPATATLLENAAVTNALRSATPGVAVAYLSGNATQASSGSRIYTAGPLNYSFTGPAQVVTPTPVNNQPPIIILVPSDGGGAAIGRTKISDGNSPLPRDRVIFDVDYFDSVPLGNGIDVHRYSPGFEKTFFNQRASFEMRFPFAATLASTVNVDGVTATDTRFGNINMTLKALLFRNDALAFSTGLGISLPTADDTNIRMINGTSLLKVKNEAVLLTPYVAGLFTPGERFFAQGWMEFTFDPNGNPVNTNTSFFGGSGNLGNLRDSTIMSVDGQVGYWVYRCNTGGLRGLAPFVEMHYNGAISSGSLLNAGQGFTIGEMGGNFDEINMSAGVIAQFGNRLNVIVGAAAPVRPLNDRTFDWQAGVRVNWFFGPAARQQDTSGATQVGGF